jgi:hypothetical protein
MLRLAAAVALAGHGLIHFMGLLTDWKLATFEQVRYGTTVFNGSVDVGETGIRVVGVGWALAGVLLIAGAWLILRGDHRAFVVVALATFASTVMCVLGLPDAIMGLVVNLALIAVLVLRVWLEPQPMRIVRR